jgi:FG-GAP-like repeat
MPPTADICTLVAEPGNAFTFVSPPPQLVTGDALRLAASTVSVTYVGFGPYPQAQAAFQAAVDIWSGLVTSSVPIKIRAEFKVLGAGVLGSAGAPYVWRDFAGAPRASTWYGDPLADALRAADNYPAGTADINANFNSAFTNWYFGTDGAAPAGKYDFMSVVLHELGHGLGFAGAASVVSGSGTIGTSGVPTIFDRFTVTETGAPMLGFVSPSVALGTQLTRAYNAAAPRGPGVYWSGARGVASNAGLTPRHYTPATWAGGSSYSHLDDAVFLPGNQNSLMTHALQAAEAIHHPGPIALGMFADMGWPLTPQALGNSRDFNLDGLPDLVFEHTNGQRYVWLMNGAVQSAGQSLTPNPMDPAVTVVGVNDFTGDGRADLLVEHATDGRVWLYHMNGTARVGQQTLRATLNQPWHVMATGDFNADGYADILWENFATGQFYVWFMSAQNNQAIYAGAGGAFLGGFIQSSPGTAIALGTTNERAVGVADINTDGKPDIVIRNVTTGAVRVWYLNGTLRTADVALSPAGPSTIWKLGAVGDYNGDTRPDLIWQHTGTGQLYAWFLNGVTMTSQGPLTPGYVNVAWRLVGPR